MAKQKKLFVCGTCGSEYPKWMGKCTHCNSWNTIEEAKPQSTTKRAKEYNVVSLADIRTDAVSRLYTGLQEFNLVCGGGIVPGSVVLIGGEPGIGKSTMALQIAHSFRTLYISGEESPHQIKHRAERLSVQMDKILISTNTVVEDIKEIILTHKPECVFVDSIQTVSSADIPGPVGSVAQIRESAAVLTEVAKKLHIPLILIGHITKEGTIAGPKILEHIVDTVLYFEGDFTKEFRILRAFKNRFGSVNEIGLFRMTAEGLSEVQDKNSLFLNPYNAQAPGNAISTALEGSRTILFEVQSLVTLSSFSNPRRMSDGFDINRLLLLAAVLEKHAGMKLANHDLFINVAGGFQIQETAADLAVAMSIVSSLKNVPITQRIGFLGEISLSGEIRPVAQVERRVQECVRNTYNSIMLAPKDADIISKMKLDCEIIAVKTIAAAVAQVFDAAAQPH
jgi:DNA repair protein RadA/Sms